MRSRSPFAVCRSAALASEQLPMGCKMHGMAAKKVSESSCSEQDGSKFVSAGHSLRQGKFCCANNLIRGSWKRLRELCTPGWLCPDVLSTAERWICPTGAHRIPLSSPGTPRTNGTGSSVLCPCQLRGQRPESSTSGNKRGSVQRMKDLIHGAAWRGLYCIVCVFAQWACIPGLVWKDNEKRNTLGCELGAATSSASSASSVPVVSGCSKLRFFGNCDQTRAGRGRTKETSSGVRRGDVQRQTCHQQQEIVNKYRNWLANQDCQYLMGNVLGGIVAQEADFTVISPNSTWYFLCEKCWTVIKPTKEVKTINSQKKKHNKAKQFKDNTTDWRIQTFNNHRPVLEGAPYSTRCHEQIFVSFIPNFYPSQNHIPGAACGCLQLSVALCVHTDSWDTSHLEMAKGQDQTQHQQPFVAQSRGLVWDRVEFWESEGALTRRCLQNGDFCRLGTPTEMSMWPRSSSRMEDMEYRKELPEHKC
ncbi:hypothetical protein Anapl_14939 [Anas platyrhynchos]|uniref:Uncharacterized protein n=1 Tax=Anas platyrhynchos TaxID=8839 RepID=R0L0Z9_ANAPL|nr:hypothetical protein Anapl_14939 [Anas platyrhynchos]